MKKQKILIVDDDPAITTTLSRILELKGYKTFTANDGAEALRIFAKNPVNLVIIDLGLPDTPGLEILNQVKSANDLSEAIILTGNASLDSAIEATNKGAFSYLIKPYEMNELMLHIRRAIEKQEAREAIARHNTELERVNDELNKANMALAVEITERKRAYETLEAEITQRQRIEEGLRHSQKMEAVGTLAGGIAHDFNNILAAIMGFAEMALDDVPRDSSLEKKLRHILNSSIRGRDLVRQILTFSRKVEYDRKPLSLSPIVKETAKLLRASIPATVQIKVDLTAVYDTVLANPGEIQQIVMNLCTNAAYAMRQDGGTMSVLLKDVEIEYDSSSTVPPGEYVCLVVSDTGAGMDEATMKRIFEPFYTTKQVGEGTGMGLAVVYGIVEGLGSHIVVESVTGEGTTFRIYFRRVERDAVPEGLPLEETPGGIGHVLLVDDEELLAELGGDILRKLGYKVTVMTDSAEALKLFSSDPSRFDVVVTDQTMPHMTGLAFAQEAFKIRRGMPIILLTGYNDMASPEIARGAGIREFLMKPLVRRELAEAISRVLDSEHET